MGKERRRIGQRAARKGALFAAGAWGSAAADAGDVRDSVAPAEGRDTQLAPAWLRNSSFSGSLQEMFTQLASEQGTVGSAATQTTAPAFPPMASVHGREERRGASSGGGGPAMECENEADEEGNEMEADDMGAFADAFLESCLGPAAMRPQRPPPRGDAATPDPSGTGNGLPHEERSTEMDCDEEEGYEWVESSAGDSEERGKSRKRRRERDSDERREERKRKRRRKKTDKEKILMLERRASKSQKRGKGGGLVAFPLGIPPALLKKGEDGGEGLFRIDIHGDRENLVYEELYRAAVPLYYRSPSGCLGLSQGEEMRYVRQHRAYLVASRKKETRKTFARYYDPSQSAQARETCQRVVPTISPAHQAGDANFLPLEVESVNAEAGDSHLPGQPPLPLGMPPTARGGGAAPEEESFEEYIRRRTKSFNEETQRQPNNEELWLEFIAFQDEYLSWRGEGGSRQQVTAVSVLSKQMAIFAVALNHNPDSEKLLLGYLRCAEELWPHERLVKLWQKVLASKQGSALLWHRYLDFRCGDLQTFHIESCRKAHQEAMSALYTEKRRLFHVGDRRGAVEAEKEWIEIFRRLCYFEFRAGYSERALALFQAQVEFSCFHPRYLHEYNDLLRAFGPFWESEAPRLGESRLSTWASGPDGADSGPAPPPQPPPSASAPGGGPPPPPTPQPPPPPPPGEDTPEMTERWEEEWARKEKESRRAAWHARRAADAGEEMEDLDVDQVVVFSDIDEYLLDVGSDEARVALILHLVEFVIATAAGAVGDGTQLRLEEHLRSSAVPENHQRWMERESAGEGLLRQVSLAVTGGAAAAVAHSSSTLSPQPQFSSTALKKDAADSLLLSMTPGEDSAGGGGLLPEDRQSFVRNVFEEALGRYPKASGLVEAYILFEARHCTARATRGGLKPFRAVCRRLLEARAQHSASLSLWYAYASAEAELGAPSEALRICDVALSMAGEAFTHVAARGPHPRARQSPNNADSAAVLSLALLYARLELAVLSKKFRELMATLKEQEQELLARGPLTTASAGLLSVTKVKGAILALYGEIAPRALHVIVCVTEGEFISIYRKKGTRKRPAPPAPPVVVAPPRLLKARARLVTMLGCIESDERQGHSPWAVQLIRCFAWLEFLSRGLAQGTTALEGALELKWGRERHLELLHEDLVAMVELHGAMHRSHVAFLRRASRRALAVFPSNLRLVTAFVRNEQQAGLDARMRRLLDEVCLQKSAQSSVIDAGRRPSLVPWLFSIAVEANRCRSRNRIVGLFEKALAVPELRRSCLLWRSYVDFLLREEQHEAARRVFFRAVRLVPASKSLWLQSAALQLPDEELLQVLDLLDEKGIRVHDEEPLVPASLA